MRLNEVPNFGHFLSESPVGGDPFFSRELAEITPDNLVLFYARSKVAGHHAAALEAIDRLQGALILSACHGEMNLDMADLIMHEVPEVEPYFADQFCDSLVKLRPPRRAACLYGLEMGMTPSDVMQLTWKDVLGQNLVPPLARELLTQANKTRHLTLPYVFWEWANTRIATPLLELGYAIESAFGCTWPVLQRRYRGMTLIDRRAEGEAFKQALERARNA